MKWLNSLKIAIIEEDIVKIGVLIEKIPKYEVKEEAQEALALVGEAIKLVDHKKSEILANMNKIKQTKVYLDSV